MKKYIPCFYCKNYEAIKNNVCDKCGKCGRRFRKGILIDNTGREFIHHVDERNK